MSIAFDFNQAGFDRFLTDTNGQLANTLEEIGDAVAVLAQETVGVDRPEPRALVGPLYWGRQALNPEPGPPFLRSGDLQASIRATPAELTSDGLQVSVIADAAHRGFAYPFWLLQNGYRFVDLERLSV